VTRQQRANSGYMQHLKKMLDPTATKMDSGERILCNLRKPKDGDWLSWKNEQHQGISEYIGKRPNRPTPGRNKIYFQPLTDGSSSASMPDLEFLQHFTAAWFGLQVVVQRPMTLATLLKIGYKTSFRASFGGSKQFNAGHILTNLRKKLPGDAYARIGVTMCDIYSSDLNFVFGLGSLNGRTGVYSFCRQDDAFYRTGGASQPGDEGEMIHRAAHTLVHELGHMCGMSHCTFYECTMQGSNGLDESAAHPLSLCPVCLLKLKYCLGIDLNVRYQRLKGVCLARPDSVFAKEVVWWGSRLQYLDTKNSPPSGTNPPSASSSSSSAAHHASTPKKLNGATGTFSRATTQTLKPRTQPPHL